MFDLESTDFNSYFNEMRKMVVLKRGNKILYFYQTLVTLNLLTHALHLPQSQYQKERKNTGFKVWYSAQKDELYM